MAGYGDRIFSQFARRLRVHEKQRVGIESAVLTKAFGHSIAADLYEGVFLAAFTTFEALLEQLAIALLMERSLPKHLAARVTVGSHQIARELLIGPGKKYADWIPYEHTEKRARVLFRGGRPFTSLAGADITAIRQATIIRNAIAHKSRHSIAEFERRVIGGVPLPARERRPGGYLRGVFRMAPKATRYEAIIGNLTQAAKTLTS